MWPFVVQIAKDMKKVEDLRYDLLDLSRFVAQMLPLQSKDFSRTHTAERSQLENRRSRSGSTSSWRASSMGIANQTDRHCGRAPRRIRLTWTSSRKLDPLV